jgi:hypothetical protein
MRFSRVHVGRLINMAGVTTRKLHTLEETAAQLRKSARWLREWLRRHPTDRHGEPFYTPLGRTKLFEDGDVARIRANAREEERCRLDSTRHGQARRRIGRSGVLTSESSWTEAQRLLSDRSPRKCSPNGKLKSSKARSVFQEKQPSSPPR